MEWRRGEERKVAVLHGIVLKSGSTSWEYTDFSPNELQSTSEDEMLLHSTRGYMKRKHKIGLFDCKMKIQKLE